MCWCVRACVRAHFPARPPGDHDARAHTSNQTKNKTWLPPPGAEIRESNVAAIAIKQAQQNDPASTLSV